MGEPRVFTRDELKTYDGKEGRPIYVGYKGKVYDVSASKMWKSGMHMRRHTAGQDLTAELAGAPHNEEVFDRVPLVGVLEPAQAVAEERPFAHLPQWLAELLERVPFLARHPHPMTVHFPIVFMIATPVFALLYLATGNEAFELTSAYILIAGVFFNLVGVGTGLLTWWVNYMARPLKPIVIKLVVSTIMSVAAAVALAWRIAVPDVLSTSAGPNLLYLLLVVSLLVLSSIVATIGATLTFPLEKRKKKGG